MSGERIGALRRWSRLLNTARRDEVPAILAALSEADLAAVVDAAEAPVSLSLCEYVLAHGSTSALIALARRVVLSECDQGERTLFPDWYRPRWLSWFIPLRNRQALRSNMLSRILRRCDPEVDAAFFDLDDAVALVRDARAAVLTHRRGRRGRAVIPPSVKQRLLAAAAEHSAHAGDEPLPANLLSGLASADDPDLVLAALPHHQHLDLTDKALAFTTLVAHGRGKVVREQYPGLWEQDARAARRLVRKTERRARFQYQGKAGPPVLSLDHYQWETRPREKRVDDSWLIRRYGIDALRTGTIAPADVIAHTRPAAVALTLTCSTIYDATLPGAKRAVDDLRILVGEQVKAAAGDDRDRWARLIRHAAGFPGTLPELLAGLDRGFPPQSYPYDDRSAHGPWNATSVLFALAPRDVAKHLLKDDAPGRDRFRDHLAAGAPLTRQLVEHIIRDGTDEQRAALAANSATPDSVLARLVKRKRLANVIAKRHFVAPAIRFTALTRHGLYKPGSLYDHPALELTKRGPEPLLSTLRTASDAAQLRTVVEAAARVAQPALRVALYALLAEAAGPEPVWALELDRAGSLDKMEPEVRDSMSSGTAEPLLTAAARYVAENSSPSGPEDEFWRAATELDQPVRHELEALVRAHLDGHPERWIALLELLAAEPEAAVEELVARF